MRTLKEIKEEAQKIVDKEGKIPDEVQEKTHKGIQAILKCAYKELGPDYAYYGLLVATSRVAVLTNTLKTDRSWHDTHTETFQLALSSAVEEFREIAKEKGMHHEDLMKLDAPILRGN